MEIIKRVPKTYENPHGYEVKDGIEEKGPTILCLSGDKAMDTKTANGFAKATLSALGIGSSNFPEQMAFEDIDIYSVSYDPDFSVSADRGYIQDLFKNYCGLNVINPRKDGDKTPFVKTVDFIYDKVFKNMLFDGDKLLPIDQIKKNFDNLTIVGYCAGTVLVLALEAKINSILQKSRLSQAECNDILKHMTSINFAPVIPMGYTKSTAVYLASGADDKIANLNNHPVAEDIANYELQGGLNEDRTAFSEKPVEFPFIKKLPGNASLVACKSLYDPDSGNDEHYSKAYTSDRRAGEQGKKLQMCTSLALSTIFKREGVVDIEKLTEQFETIMNGELDQAKEIAQKSIKEKLHLRPMSKEEIDHYSLIEKIHAELMEILDQSDKIEDEKISTDEIINNLKTVSQEDADLVALAAGILRTLQKKNNEEIKKINKEIDALDPSDDIKRWKLRNDRDLKKLEFMKKKNDILKKLKDFANFDIPFKKGEIPDIYKGQYITFEACKTEGQREITGFLAYIEKFIREELSLGIQPELGDEPEEKDKDDYGDIDL